MFWHMLKISVLGPGEDLWTRNPRTVSNWRVVFTTFTLQYNPLNDFQGVMKVDPKGKSIWESISSNFSGPNVYQFSTLNHLDLVGYSQKFQFQLISINLSVSQVVSGTSSSGQTVFSKSPHRWHYSIPSNTLRLLLIHLQTKMQLYGYLHA